MHTLKSGGTYLEDSDRGPEQVVEMHPVTATVRVLCQDLLTSALRNAVRSHAKLASKEQHTKHTGKTNVATMQNLVYIPVLPNPSI